MIGKQQAEFDGYCKLLSEMRQREIDAMAAESALRAARDRMRHYVQKTTGKYELFFGAARE